MPGIEKLWFQPCNFYIDEESRVTLFYPKSTSLFQILHDKEADQSISLNQSESLDRRRCPLNHILKDESPTTKKRIKYQIAFQLS